MTTKGNKHNMQSLVASIPDSSTGEDVAAKQRTTAGTVNCQGGTISIYKLNCRLLKHIYKNTHTHTQYLQFTVHAFLSLLFVVISRHNKLA